LKIVCDKRDEPNQAFRYDRRLNAKKRGATHLIRLLPGEPEIAGNPRPNRENEAEGEIPTKVSKEWSSGGGGAFSTSRAGRPTLILR